MTMQDILDAYESIRSRTGALPDEVEVEASFNYGMDYASLELQSADGKTITLRKVEKP